MLSGLPSFRSLPGSLPRGRRLRVSLAPSRTLGPEIGRKADSRLLPGLAGGVPRLSVPSFFLPFGDICRRRIGRLVRCRSPSSGRSRFLAAGLSSEVVVVRRTFAFPGLAVVLPMALVLAVHLAMPMRMMAGLGCGFVVGLVVEASAVLPPAC